MKLARTILAVALGAAIHAAPVSAEILDGWNFNLSLIGTGGTDATNIDRIEISGESYIEQTVTGFVSAGQSFTDSGFLEMTGYRKEGLNPQYNFDLPDGYDFIYIKFTGLTGILNNDGSITFDAGSGTVGLYLDPGDGVFDGVGDLEIASYSVIAPSGGSDLDFYGGGGANATVDVTLDLLSTLAAGLFTDSGGNPLDPGFALHLVNVDSLIDEDFDPNPDDNGLDVNGDGIVKIWVENGGQYKVTTVPEPASLALLGMGLLGMGMARRRKS